MSSAPVKPIKPKKPESAAVRKLYTPKPVHNRVIARHIEGESNRKIAVEEGIDRATVSRILSQEELVVVVAEQQSRLLRLGSKAITVLEEALDCNYLGLAAATATKILEGTGVLGKRSLKSTIDLEELRQSTKNSSEEFVWPPVVALPGEVKSLSKMPPNAQLLDMQEVDDDYGLDDLDDEGEDNSK